MNERIVAITGVSMALLNGLSGTSIADTAHTQDVQFCHPSNKVHAICVSSFDDGGVIDWDKLYFKCELRRQTSLMASYKKTHTGLGTSGKFIKSLHSTLMANVDWCAYNASRFTGGIFWSTGSGRTCKNTSIDGTGGTPY